MLVRIGIMVILALFCAGRTQAEEPKNVGATTCIGCHADQGEAFKNNIHAKALPAVKKIGSEESCETCHGPGSLHAEAAGDKNNPGYATIKNTKNLSATEAANTC